MDGTSVLGAIFPLPPLKIFGLELHAFGFLVGTGIILGTIFAQRRAKQLGLSEQVVAEVALWAVIPGFIGAHLVHQLFYFPEELVTHSVDGIVKNIDNAKAILSYPLYEGGHVIWKTAMAGEPWKILKFWEGISSFGGFVGGTLGVVWYFFKRRKRELPFLPYADAIIFGFCFAWIFGRMGCMTAFDHPGHETDFFLGMEFRGNQHVGPGIRHNLGMYEMMWTCLMFLVFWLNRNKSRFKGWYLAMFVVMYMPVRFMWDFLRAVDERYAGLTPGQWIAIVLMSLGIWLVVANRRSAPLVPDGKPKPEFWPKRDAERMARSGAK